MKLEDHVERIRLKVEDAVKNALDRCGITVDTWDKDREIDSNIEIGNYVQLIESIQSGNDWSYCYDEIVDDYAFTLFNRLICMKVLESHGLYPEMVTQRQQHSGKSYAHYMWLETNGQYSNVPFEGLEKYLSWQFDQLSSECDLFAVAIPLHMVPTATFCKEIIDLINAVDEDDQIENDIWKQGNILSQIYEIYNNSKKAALKASGDKVEYDKVHVQSQIYTPEWVVQFLVDNSLGKMYLEMFPDSDIKNQHKIIGNFSEITREKKPLDEIKIIDPCVGSGNFLLYCFDLLYEMYMDQIDNYGADYSKRKVPELIIERNLHGIDLDERAVQLTKVGLFIKAKTKRSSVHISHYNIVSASFHLPEYSEIGTLFDAQYFSKQFSDLLKEVWGDLKQAYKFGSLLRIDEKFEDVKNSLKEDIGEAQLSLFTYKQAAEFDIFERTFYERLKDAISKYATDNKKKYYAKAASNALTYLRVITGKYSVVATNPPYMESDQFGGELRSFLMDNYVYNNKKYNADLYNAFFVKNFSYLIKDGYLAMIQPQSYMHVVSYVDLREIILTQKHIEVLADCKFSVFPKVLVDVAINVFKNGKSENESLFMRLDKPFEAEHFDEGNMYSVNQREF
nr:N-6 DNA methylase [Lachnospiraceae bacterium]